MSPPPKLRGSFAFGLSVVHVPRAAAFAPLATTIRLKVYSRSRADAHPAR
jgi:hypothetical protein